MGKDLLRTKDGNSHSKEAILHRVVILHRAAIHLSNLTDSNHL